jgi:malate dehydrogenase (oxaloacetate-decarboxylating)
MYIFPGVGLGALVAKAAKVTNGMLMAASRALSALVTPEQEAMGLMLPAMEDIRSVSAQVALAVAGEARDTGLGRILDDPELERVVRRAQWHPEAIPLRAAVFDGSSAGSDTAGRAPASEGQR